MSNVDSSNAGSGKKLVHLLLVDQGHLTAVEKFAQKHDAGELPHNAEYYRALIPLSEPKAGQQYAFEVDLDACTGCKACVTACHTLNGLDEGEVWRSVGLVHGRVDEGAFQQTITTACHHCVEPACLEGCPVGAYDKNPVTGIVKHLDDQCIGCQYCVLKCPYDVPKYNVEKGIVRKCDMCSDRLSGGEAPACVQACPNTAIRIGIVDKAEARAKAGRGDFLATAPSPTITLPTTSYTTSREIPVGVVAGDHLRVEVQSSHLPLVFMLVVTQMAMGALGVERALAHSTLVSTPPELPRALAAFACAAGILGVHLSLLHLGRPLYAFRAFIGLRTSWLSREAVAFGGLMPMLLGYAAVKWAHLAGMTVPASIATLVGDGVALAGAGSIFCSVMVWVDTHRPSWSLLRTATKFFATALLLGLSAAGAGAAMLGDGQLARAFAPFVAVVTLGKLAVELEVLRHLRAKERTPLQKTAILMGRTLRGATIARVALGLAGGVVLPLSLLTRGDATAHYVIVASAAALALSLLGELAERYLFFTTVSSSKMPGAPNA